MFDVKTFEPHLVYFAKQVSGLDGFFAGKKIKAYPDSYFFFEQLLLRPLDKGQREYNSTTGYFDTYYDCEWMVRLTVYGEDCTSKAFLIKSSLNGEVVPTYLYNHGISIARSTEIKTLNEFYITEFLPQAQIDLTFNINLSITEDLSYIENADIEFEEVIAEIEEV